MTPKVVTVDFETEAIAPRPNYPPRPVSLGLKWPDQRGYELLAWGHPTGNNTTEKKAQARLKAAYNSHYGILCQYGAFDLDVAETHWQLPLPPVERTHDTMYLIFLDDPHAESLSLKPSAHRLLNIPPEEQDRMFEWIVTHIQAAARKPSTAGAYISECPFTIVKPYLRGDLRRTLRIFEHLYPKIERAGMLEAYMRERRLMPILLRNAQRGMRVDLAALERDLPTMKDGLKRMERWLCKQLGDINLNSDKQLGEALYNKGVVTDFRRTPKGQLSVSKKYLTIDKFKDKRVYQALNYYGQMSTSVSMFVEPWLELAGATKDGVLHPNWAQVRSPKGDSRDTKGARSGRIICSKPNLLNIPKKWKRAITAGYVHPTFVKVPELPYMRKYVLPGKGKRWGRRDYNQQEVRLFGHFEEGPVAAGFLNEPRFDMHEGVRAAEEAALVAAGLRTSFDRDSAKTTVFGAFYGQGLSGLMDSLKLSEDDRTVGQLIHKALHRAAPSIKQLSNELKELAGQGLPIRTWGGRLYYCEPPQYSEQFGRDMTFEYKLISYLIQGSGADVMKEAICRYYEHPKRTEEMIVTVYDELNINLPVSKAGQKQEMTLLRDVMQSIECDVPMLSDGETGPNWGELNDYKI